MFFYSIAHYISAIWQSTNDVLFLTLVYTKDGHSILDFY